MVLVISFRFLARTLLFLKCFCSRARIDTRKWNEYELKDGADDRRASDDLCECHDSWDFSNETCYRYVKTSVEMPVGVLRLLMIRAIFFYDGWSFPQGDVFTV